MTFSIQRLLVRLGLMDELDLRMAELDAQDDDGFDLDQLGIDLDDDDDHGHRLSRQEADAVRAASEADEIRDEIERLKAENRQRQIDHERQTAADLVASDVASATDYARRMNGPSRH